MFNDSKILADKFLVLSVVGVHAGETLSEIFDRKQAEIENTGKSFWLIKSFKAKTKTIQHIGKTASDIQQEIYCLFIAPAQQGGAQPTKINLEAKQYSEDAIQWLDIPNGIKITGKIDIHTTGLVLSLIDIVENTEIDLWQYSDFLDITRPIKMSQGASSVCVLKRYNEGMKSRIRKVVGIAKLKTPYAIYLK